VSDESRLQVTPKHGDSMLALSKTVSGLVARGRRDAAALPRPAPPAPPDPGSEWRAETRQLAEEGDASAQHIIGLLYAAGQGVIQSYAEAVKWYRLAAKQGYAHAQYELGFSYAEGPGVPQDHARAIPEVS
jgi:TPR repeat protein